MKRWQDVHDFWFKLDPVQWFKKDESLDQRIRQKFGPWLEHFEMNDFEVWKIEPQSLISLVILLDQFPRNAFRGTAQSFQYDVVALDVAREGLEKGFDTELSVSEASFLVLPFEHSEDITDQRDAVRLAKELVERGAGKELYEFALKHLEIIERFGRFPHRNVILGRPSTPEEIEFLKQPGSSF